jgi:hypothetical protein
LENVLILHLIIRGATSSQESKLPEKEKLPISGCGKERNVIEWKWRSSPQPGPFIVISPSNHSTLETGKLKYGRGIMC